jgi:hypothetical protein
MLRDPDKAVAYGLQLILGEAESVNDPVHAAEGAVEGCRQQVGAYLDGSPTEEPASRYAGQEQFDAVVDLVEEVGPLGPRGFQPAQRGPNLGEVDQLA